MRLELTDDQEAFRDTVRRFADQAVRPRAAQIDADDQFPRDLVREAGARGLMGVTIPVDAGRDYVSYALAIEAIATASATLAVILAVNNSLVAEVVAQFGTTGVWQPAKRWAPSPCRSRMRAPMPRINTPPPHWTVAAIVSTDARSGLRMARSPTYC